MRCCLPLLIWTLLVLYPNPSLLYVSAQRAWSPPLDAQAVAQLARSLPDDPRAIEAAISNRVVVYAVPWDTYGVPWYFPTVAEVLRQGRGDCEAQAVMLASVLQAKGIPARLVGSFDHLWVDYPGKGATASENAAVAVVAQQADGRYQLRWPQRLEWQTSWAIERAYFWDHMPVGRRVLLGGGWLVIALWSRGRQRPWRVRWRGVMVRRTQRQGE